MSVVPVIISGVFYPKNKKDPPMPGAFIGNAAIYGLEVGGGPVIPETPPEPPVTVWPPGFWGGPEHPIVIPPSPPELPPDLGGVGKPPPPDGGWGYHPQFGWGYFPGTGTQPGPKK